LHLFERSALLSFESACVDSVQLHSVYQVQYTTKV